MIVVNLIAIALILLIIWWFWIYEPDTYQVSQGNIEVIVENGVYIPADISINKREVISLNFLRKDASPCAGTLIFPELAVNHELSLNKKTSVDLSNIPKGDYEFHCQMKMYKGVLHVK